MPRGCDTDAADVWDAFWRRRDLLRAVEGGATRTELSEATGVSEKRLAGWVEQARERLE